jgi:hypothetical protein
MPHVVDTMTSSAKKKPAPTHAGRALANGASTVAEKALDVAVAEAVRVLLEDRLAVR